MRGSLSPWRKDLTGVELIDLDLNSPAGAGLIEAVADRHGRALARVASVPARLFLLRSAWAPGLSVVGGQVAQGRLPAAVAPAGPFNLAGSGQSIEEAFVSCLGEAVERISQLETPGEATSAPFADCCSEVMPAATALIEAQLGRAGLPRHAVVDWVGGRTLGSGGRTLVPADWCLRRPSDGALRDGQTALSTGTAAGASFAGAAVRALLELIERDAASQWWIGGRRGRSLPVDGSGIAEAARVLSGLRKGGTERASWLLDITTDLGVPAVAALSVGSDARGLACGLAARLTIAEAARAAVLELAQMELGLLVAMTKQRAKGGTLGEVDHRHLARATVLDAATCALIHPLGAPHHHGGADCGDDKARLDALRAAFAGARVEAALVDLTRSEHAIAVVKAVAPDLQLMPSGIVTERLRRAIAETGGGGRWTHGVSLV